MSDKSKATAFCVFVFLAIANLAQSGTLSHRGKQQDNQFLRTIAIADMTEAHAGEMAQSTAAGKPVKDFGQTVAKDDAEEYAQLTVLANKTGDIIPKGINAR